VYEIATCHAAGAAGVAAATLGTAAHSVCSPTAVAMLDSCAVLPNLRATHPREAPQGTPPPPVCWSDPAEPPPSRGRGNSGPALATLIAAPAGRVRSPTWPFRRILSDFTRSIFGRRRRWWYRRLFFRELPPFGVSLCGLER
jgi:hypothetical protein